MPHRARGCAVSAETNGIRRKLYLSRPIAGEVEARSDEGEGPAAARSSPAAPHLPTPGSRGQALLRSSRPKPANSGRDARCTRPQNHNALTPITLIAHLVPVSAHDQSGQPRAFPPHSAAAHPAPRTTPAVPRHAHEPSDVPPPDQSTSHDTNEPPQGSDPPHKQQAPHTEHRNYAAPQPTTHKPQAPPA
jgi:hypothetical protein